MKKIIIFIISFSLIFNIVYANDEPTNKRFGFNDRTVEFGFNISAGFSNNLFAIGDIFKEKIYLDFDALDRDLNINVNSAATPFYFKFNRNNNWGFGFSVNLETFGLIGLSQNLLSFSEAVNDKSDAGFAVFSDASFDVSLRYQKFKINIRPSVFYPIVYSKPDLSYTFSTAGTSILSIDYDARIYTAFQIDDIDNINFDFNFISATPGLDISIGIEYPLSKELGINKNFALFDFDVGLELLNIPLKASSMRHYIQLAGNATLEGDTLDEFFNSFDEDELFSDPDYGEDKIFVKRPFRTVLYANWRPLGSKVFTITPQLGFSVNPIYLDPFSMEGGIKARMNLANMFILMTGTNYEDRIWKNTVDIALNFRIVELNIGAELRAKKILSLANTSGFAFNLGMKFGW